ncbi:MAG: 30S ribosome-binding factor RbfA [Candidatus Krumholzibacteriota bacterium]|nr:30S ribosome-binding factor RbfA [Candidatus Krumholzibacteriota bacterium]
MNGKHKARVEETIHQLVAQLLVRKVKDPRVTNVSIIRVEAAKDYSIAKIFYNIIGGSENLEEVARGLSSSRGFIRSQVKKAIRLRVIPELVFIYDSSLDKAMELEDLIDRLHQEKEPRNGEPDSAPPLPEARSGGVDND